MSRIFQVPQYSQSTFGNKFVQRDEWNDRIHYLHDSEKGVHVHNATYRAYEHREIAVNDLIYLTNAEQNVASNLSEVKDRKVHDRFTSNNDVFPLAYQQTISVAQLPM